MSVFFVGGIDTDAGKSYATGMMARYLHKRKIRIITQKLVQTGVELGMAEDLLLHRTLMGVKPFPRDLDGTTCREIFKFPASPHLAAAREQRIIDLKAITAATELLEREFDTILLEGAGGLHVPLKRGFLSIDYLAERHYPLILVTSGKLGSINHTLMSLETAAARGIKIAGMVFNRFFDTNPEISADALEIFCEALKKYSCPNALVELPAIDKSNPPDVSFASIFDKYDS